MQLVQGGPRRAGNPWPGPGLGSAAAGRKLPQITALIERTELVRSWLESAARCECPDLDQCPLFDDPPLDAAPRGLL